ncbi:MAG: hypothetical protein IT305_15530 [Chloroflexi bacterium]|nr:hypothetical protein [Chloroflexota bacterium]
MHELSRLRRALLLTAVALVVMTSTIVVGEDALAKSKKKSDNGNDNSRDKATVVIYGAVARQDSCEGKLSVDLRYTFDDRKTRAVNVPIEKNGKWSFTMEKVKKGWLEVTADVVHPERSSLYYDDASFQVRRGRDTEYDMGRIRVPACE